MFAHLVLVLASVAIVVFLGQKSLCFLVDQLVEEDGQERGSEWDRRVEVDCLPGGEAVVEQAAHLDAHGDGGVHHGTVGRHCIGIAVEHSASSHEGSGQNEAVDGFFVTEEEFFVSVSHEEEDIDERAEQLLEESAQEKVINESELG